MTMSWLAALWLCAGARAQPADTPEPQAQESQSEAGAQEGQQAPAEAPRTTTVEDVKTSFGTMVQSFITSNSPNGYWPLRQKRTHRLLKLHFVRAVERTIHEVDSGRFAGRVVMRQEGSEGVVTAEFVLDCTGTDWKVDEMRHLVIGRPPAVRESVRPAPPAQVPAPSAQGQQGQLEDNDGGDRQGELGKNVRARAQDPGHDKDE